MKPNNAFNITDATYQQEQRIISNFFYELWEGKTALGEKIPVNGAAYYAIGQLNKTINKYPSWKLIHDADPIQAARYIMALMNLYHHLETKKPKPADWNDFTRITQKQLIGRLMKKSITFSQAQVIALLDILIKKEIEDFPVGLWIQQLENYFTHQPLTTALTGKLIKYKIKLKAKQAADLQIVLQKNQGEQNITEATFPILSKPGDEYSEIFDDAFALSVDTFLKSQKGERQKLWNELFFMANKLADAAIPPKKSNTDRVVETITPKLFKEQLLKWLAVVNNREPMVLELTEYYNKVGILNEYSIDILKGLIWIAIPIMDKTLIKEVATLAMGCYEPLSPESEKIYKQLKKTKCDPDRDTHFKGLPDRLGVACFKAMGAVAGNKGIMQLIDLRNRIKGIKAKAIDKIIEQEAKARGISKSEMEDAAAPEL